MANYRFGSIATLAILSIVIAVSAKPSYEWRSVAPRGSGCFPPKCEAGKYPMATLPLAAPDGRLYSIGQDTVWISADGLKWNAKPKTDWGTRHGMQFVHFAGRLWMLGGMRGWGDFCNDVWNSADGIEWKRVTENAPWRERRDHAAFILKERIWVVGGSISSGRPDVPPTTFHNDIWSSADGLNWKREPVTVPWNPGDSHSFLNFLDKVWMIGGRGDVWSSADARNWVKVKAKAPWDERIGNGAVAFDGRIWIFGGREKNDVWSSADGKKWELSFAAAPWSTRSANYSVVFNHRIWLFSGKTGRDDSWDGEIWAMSRKSE